MKIAMWEPEGWVFLTNEGLAVGDEVFPLVNGYHTNGQFFVVGMVERDDTNYMRACTGYPSEPHTIKEFYPQEGLQYIRTDKGYSPAERYFKVFTPMPKEKVEDAKQE